MSAVVEREVAIHASQAGAGEPALVFVHGLGCAHDDYAELVNRHILSFAARVRQAPPIHP